MLRRATVPTSHNQNSGLEYLLVSPSTGTNRDHFLQADSPYLSARCPTGLLPNRRLLPANILNHTRKSCRPEGLFSSSWIFVSGGRSSASGSDLGRSSRGRAPTKYDSVYPTFRIAAQAGNGLGRELRRGYSAAMSGL